MKLSVFKRLTAIAALATSIAVQAAPVLASTRSNEAHHIALIETAKAHGITFQANTVECFEKQGAQGFYSGVRRLIVVCQPGRIDYIGDIANFTEDDLDTIRHEVQHFIQDCTVGGNHDHTLAPVHKDPVKLAVNVLGSDLAARIIGVYRGHDASDDTLKTELEAFAVAALNDPLEQVKDITTYCGA